MRFYQLLKEYDYLKEAFQYVLTHNGDSTFNPYHNLNHMMIVTEYAYILGRGQLSKSELKELLIVSIFHDFQHTAGSQKDYFNIKLAKDGIADFFKKSSFKIDINKLHLILSATQFPYVIPDEDLILQQKIIRDADLCQLLEPTRIQHNILGLQKELGLTYFEILTGQKEFVNNIKFYTQPAELLYELKTIEINEELDVLLLTKNLFG